MISLDYPSSLRFSPEKLAAEELCVLDFGIDNTGTLDNTALMQALHSTGRRIYYPNGVYLFNGDTLDLSGGVRFETREGVTVRNRISPMNIIVFDDFGNLIGLMENHLEYTERDLGRTSGSLVPPPLSQSKRKTRADLIAYWYNDFGLQCHKTLRYGWIGWHYWTWNHHDAAVSPALREQFGRQMDGYDPSRHPLLGFYHGDDPTVLDWQCYWLYEYGVNAVSLLGGDLARWEDPLHGSHFVYQLFHHVKNFKNLKYIMTGPTPWVKPEDAPAAAREVEDTCLRLLDKTYAAFPNYYAFTEDGADFPVLSFLGENALLSVFDPAGGIDGTVTFYLRLARFRRDHGVRRVPGSPFRCTGRAPPSGGERRAPLSVELYAVARRPKPVQGGHVPRPRRQLRPAGRSAHDLGRRQQRQHPHPARVGVALPRQHARAVRRIPAQGARPSRPLPRHAAHGHVLQPVRMGGGRPRPAAERV